MTPGRVSQIAGKEGQGGMPRDFGHDPLGGAPTTERTRNVIEHKSEGTSVVSEEEGQGECLAEERTLTSTGGQTLPPHKVPFLPVIPGTAFPRISALFQLTEWRSGITISSTRAQPV